LSGLALPKEKPMAQAVKPANLPTNAMPTEGYVLAVDGKLKTRYDTSEAAVAAATKLKQSFPMVQTAVYDAAARVYTKIDPGTPAAQQGKQDEKKKKNEEDAT
jgi:hypothetical protein